MRLKEMNNLASSANVSPAHQQVRNAREQGFGGFFDLACFSMDKVSSEQPGAGARGQEGKVGAYSSRREMSSASVSVRDRSGKDQNQTEPELAPQVPDRHRRAGAVDIEQESQSLESLAEQGAAIQGPVVNSSEAQNSESEPVAQGEESLAQEGSSMPQESKSALRNAALTASLQIAENVFHGHGEVVSEGAAETTLTETAEPMVPAEVETSGPVQTDLEVSVQPAVQATQDGVIQEQQPAELSGGTQEKQTQVDPKAVLPQSVEKAEVDVDLEPAAAAAKTEAVVSEQPKEKEATNTDPVKLTVQQKTDFSGKQEPVAVLQETQPRLTDANEKEQIKQETAWSNPGKDTQVNITAFASLGGSGLGTQDQPEGQRQNLPNGNEPAVSALTAEPGKSGSVSEFFQTAKPSATESDVMGQNVDRIVQPARTLTQRNQSMIQLRLDPPELGVLRIEMRHTSEGLTLQLQATNPRAQQLLQENVSQLSQALEAQGFSTHRIDIQLRLDLRNNSQSSPQDQPFDQQQDGAGQNNPGQQQGFYADQQQEQGYSYASFADFAEPSGEEEQVGSASRVRKHTDQWNELSFNRLDVKV